MMIKTFKVCYKTVFGERKEMTLESKNMWDVMCYLNQIGILAEKITKIEEV